MSEYDGLRGDVRLYANAFLVVLLGVLVMMALLLVGVWEQEPKACIQRVPVVAQNFTGIPTTAQVVDAFTDDAMSLEAISEIDGLDGISARYRYSLAAREYHWEATVSVDRDNLDATFKGEGDTFLEAFREAVQKEKICRLDRVGKGPSVRDAILSVATDCGWGVTSEDANE